MRLSDNLPPWLSRTILIAACICIIIVLVTFALMLGVKDRLSPQDFDRAHALLKNQRSE